MEKLNSQVKELKEQVEKELQMDMLFSARERIENFLAQHQKQTLAEEERKEIIEISEKILKIFIAKKWAGFLQELSKLSEEEKNLKIAEKCIKEAYIDWARFVAILLPEELSNKLLIKIWAICVTNAYLQQEKFWLEKAEKTAIFLTKNFEDPTVEIISKYQQIPKLIENARKNIKIGNFDEAFKELNEVEGIRIKTIEEVCSYLDKEELLSLLEKFIQTKGLSDSVSIKILEIVAKRYKKDKLKIRN
jgi:hypothetical protein